MHAAYLLDVRLMIAWRWLHRVNEVLHFSWAILVYIYDSRCAMGFKPRARLLFTNHIVDHTLTGYYSY